MAWRYLLELWRPNWVLASQHEDRWGLVVWTECTFWSCGDWIEFGQPAWRQMEMGHMVWLHILELWQPNCLFWPDGMSEDGDGKLLWRWGKLLCDKRMRGSHWQAIVQLGTTFGELLWKFEVTIGVFHSENKDSLCRWRMVSGSEWHHSESEEFGFTECGELLQIGKSCSRLNRVAMD